METIYTALSCLAISLLGLMLSNWLARQHIAFFTRNGRLSRLSFLAWWIGSTVIMFLLTALSKAMLDIAINLPTYWAVRTYIFLSHILMMPIYYSMYARRFHDFGFPGWLGLPAGIFVIFSHTYGLQHALTLLLSIAVFILNLGLALIPGTKGNNAYGTTEKPNRHHKNKKKYLD